MKSSSRYKDIDQTMRGIVIQINDSLEYCYHKMPKFETPEQLFQFCRATTTYHLDPPGDELLQTVPTMYADNWWNIPGAGDCDCFTILTISMCIVNGWNDNDIILVGRRRSAPVHIYSGVCVNGKYYTMDLTNAYINIERPYKFKQTLHV